VEIHAAISVLDHLGIKAVVPQVFDKERINLCALEVNRINEFVPVRADDECSDAAKGFSLGQIVLVEQDLFGILERIFFSAIDGILAALFHARVVEILASFLRDA
jgi:hypothetical protein